MKKLFDSGALALAFILGVPAQAATDSATVTVTINLTSKCVFGTMNAVVFNYTSFQTTAATSTGGTFNIKCTNTLPYKIGFTNGATPATTEVVNDNALNLGYTLGLSATIGTGSGVDQAYIVSGTMAAAQSGTCAIAGGACTNSTATNKTRTIYVAY